MKVGDEVIVIEENRFTEIVAIACDDYGVDVYMVEGSSKDYYEKDLYLIDLKKAIDKLLETKDRYLKDELDYSIQIVLNALTIALEENENYKSYFMMLLGGEEDGATKENS